METKTTKTKYSFTGWFGLCRIRHTLVFISIGLMLLYEILRKHPSVTNSISRNFTRPYHKLLGTAANILPFSLAELLIAAAIICALGFTIWQCVLLIKNKKGRLSRLYRLVITLLCAALCIYSSSCFLWSVYYYSEDFQSKSGIIAEDVSTDRLQAVTAYFVNLANSCADDVTRDENGLYKADTDTLFRKAEHLYDSVSSSFPCLEGRALRPKKLVFSEIMSYMHYTGFFFAFTGEANLNTETPDALLPSTIAHELAHQRGVAKEDEANFVAVLSCLESGDAEFCYSASLMAYIHLGNALHDADYDAWEKIYDTISPQVRADLDANNAFWTKYETPVAEATEAIYSDFLQSQGQELGNRSYGACVDLLVKYYYETAVNEVKS